nr:hypothetical protein [uncultured Dyadobacter sp.]
MVKIDPIRPAQAPINFFYTQKYLFYPPGFSISAVPSGSRFAWPAFLILTGHCYTGITHSSETENLILQQRALTGAIASKRNQKPSAEKPASTVMGDKNTSILI